jgi:hypothetical protein
MGKGKEIHCGERTRDEGTERDEVVIASIVIAWPALPWIAMPAPAPVPVF